MNEVTKILRAAESGGAVEYVTEKLLPLVYDELRRLAAHRMAGQQPGQTLQATALVHEDPDLAKIVNLRYFAGMTVPETAAALGVSPSTIDRQWACARAWLFREITEGNRL